MKVSEIFPSKYLKAGDLQGHEPTVVISRYAMEEIGDERKLVLYFQGKEKGMICNRTNADRIEFLYSEDVDTWIGKPIKLCAEMVNFKGKVVQGLRVKPPTVNGKSIQPQPQPQPQHASQSQYPQQTTVAGTGGFSSRDGGRYKINNPRSAPLPDTDELPDEEVPF